MAAYDFNAPRLFLDIPMREGVRHSLDRAQANYLLSVLRKDTGEPVLVFNGRDGEWRAEIEPTGRKAADLVLRAQTRPQTSAGDLHYLFAPLKAARLDYVAQKAVEMGASLIQPVVTRRTQGDRIKLDKLHANAIEAAEQCGILSLPEIRDATPLAEAVAALAPERLLVFCDEDAPVADPVAALTQAGAAAAGTGVSGRRTVPLAVVIGPEGGFTPEERAVIGGRANTVRLSLGPRILRADTAAVAVLALVQAVLGDGRSAI
ncbi:16S rRNA (uracil(1498)-N(3))-methyltransferase [Methylobacterium terricola]|uniref:Ribosomal RNA small subunit methyltransferase E n=1 Tax=Methylobacterium terricola TaxID=2583531 RepID=A0A5C4LB99_9HYPH|nr:16S rRNA (uracil(1498)-N(3))-methyltransferase [Methylobacterium terricola]TNC10264.1 16S rRNA (uracil(1498)-N(3))-methyltransferase [Methylobacterium terricola]